VPGKCFNTELHLPSPNEMCMFSQFRCRKCKIHRLTGLVLERPFWVAGSYQFCFFFFPCPHVAFHCSPDERESSSVSSFYKNSCAVCLDPCYVTSFDLHHLLKSPVCNADSLGIRASTWKFREDKYILFITLPNLKFLLHPVLEDYLWWVICSSTQHFFPTVF
jgi:hypothetical protein